MKNEINNIKDIISIKSEEKDIKEALNEIKTNLEINKKDIENLMTIAINSESLNPIGNKPNHHLIYTQK